MKRRNFLTAIPLIAAIAKAVGNEKPPEPSEVIVDDVRFPARQMFPKREEPEGQTYAILYDGGPRDGEMEFMRVLPSTIDAYVLDRKQWGVGMYSGESLVDREVSATLVGQYHLVLESVPTGLYTYRFRPLPKKVRRG